MHARSGGWSRLAIQLAASLAAAVVLFVLAFDRYSYRDYEVTRCQAGPVELVVRLDGSFDPEHPRERASPYDVRIEVTGPGQRDVALEQVRLTSLASGRTVDPGVTRAVEVSGQGDDRSSVVYSAAALALAYEDYVLAGAVVARHGGETRSAAFSCPLNRQYHSEWRAPFWDALMSV